MERNSTPSICKMGCGFFGNHSLGGMCSKCHKESVLNKTLSNEQLGTETSSSQTPSQTNIEQGKQTSKASLHKDIVKPVETVSEKKKDGEESGTSTASTSSTTAEDSASGSNDKPPAPKKRNRCFSCRKRVGLTGMECRCGEIFCGLHRYSDKHNCPFDYKADGRKRLAQENPMIIGEKIKKI